MIIYVLYKFLLHRELFNRDLKLHCNLSCSGMSLLDPHYFAGLSISSLASVDADGDIDPLSHDQVTIHSDGMYESSASYFDKVQEESYIGR